MTDPNDMTFMEHLKELRSRIIRMFLFAGLILICCLPFTNLIYSFISAPLMELMPAGSSMIATEVATSVAIMLLPAGINSINGAEIKE